MIVVAFKSVFHLKIHKIMFFFKKLFFISTHQNNPKTLKNYFLKNTYMQKKQTHNHIGEGEGEGEAI
jgi:hypothetical protein